MRNKQGPRTLPCGTPDWTLTNSERAPLTTVHCLPSIIPEVRDLSADFPLDAILVELVDQETVTNLIEGLSKVHNEDVCLLPMC